MIKLSLSCCLQLPSFHGDLRISAVLSESCITLQEPFSSFRRLYVDKTCSEKDGFCHISLFIFIKNIVFTTVTWFFLATFVQQVKLLCVRLSALQFSCQKGRLSESSFFCYLSFPEWSLFQFFSLLVDHLSLFAEAQERASMGDLPREWQSIKNNKFPTAGTGREKKLRGVCVLICVGRSWDAVPDRIEWSITRWNMVKHVH